MDLSVEAECFGSTIRVSDDEVPTVIGSVISADLDEDERMEQAEAMEVPEVGAGRTQIYIDAIEKACKLIEDRPVFAGVIGPFSLAGRLLDVTEAMVYCYDEPDMVHIVLEKATEFIIKYIKAYKAVGPFSLAGRLLDVTEAMVYCYDEPDMVHIVLEKATEFIIKYIKAYKAVGANGVVIAEPLAGLLSPALAQEFSGDYCKRIVDAVQDENFIVVYHNCGNTTILTLDSILSCGAKVYHFGNAIDMAEMMAKMPADTLAMGNVDPAGEFRGGTPESIRKATHEVMEACCKYPNFCISSGCDIPPMSSWDNIDAFFAAVDEFYAK